MKKSIYTLLAAVAVLALAAACSKDNGHKSSPKQQVTITASIPEDGLQSKVSLTQDAVKQPIKVEWDDDDVITVNGETFTIDPTTISADGKSAKFTGSDPGAGPYDISYSDISDYVNQTQSADGNIDHLGFAVSLTGADSYASFSFTETWATAHGATYEGSSVLELKAALPAAIKSSVQKVIFTFPEEITTGNKRITVTLGSSALDADNQLDVYATLPAGTINLPNILVQFQVSASENDKYSAYREFAANNTIASGSLQYLGIQCANIESFANASNASIGSSSNPYLVGDRHQLELVASEMVAGQTTYFKLVDDINMTGVTWTRLNPDPFTKAINLDGNNKTISYLDNCLFQDFNGTAQNLTLDHSTIAKNGELIGTLACTIKTADASITNVDVSNSTLTSSNNNPGGLVSDIEAAATITDCDITNTTLSGYRAGGLAYFANAEVTISNCSFSGGSVTGTANYVGGLLGSTGNYASIITGCRVEDATITVSRDQDIRAGGFIGILQTNATIKGCTVGTATKKVTLNTPQPASGKVLNCGGFVGVAYGTITKDDSGNRCKAYVKVTCANTLGQQLNLGGFAGYHQGTIEYSDAVVDMSDIQGQYIGGFSGYMPSANSKADHCTVNGSVRGNNYTGMFVGYVGNSATITNNTAAGTLSGQSSVGGFAGYLTGNPELTDNTTSAAVTSRNGANCGGFVGGIEGATLTRCSATGSVTKGGNTNNIYGGFSGYATDASLDGCYSTADVDADADNTEYVGGFIGQVKPASGQTVDIENCYATGDVYGKGRWVGGFIGYIYEATPGTASVTKCHATGNVTNTGNYTGGFIGRIMMTTDVDIKKCYATGSVSSTGTYVSGFIADIDGVANHTISDCYSTGALTAQSTRYRGGLLAGVQASPTSVTISNCYTTCEITGLQEVGGLIGRVNGTNCTVENCAAWNPSVSASNRLQTNWSSGAVIGTTHPNCHVSDTYRKPGMTLAVYCVPESGFDQLDINGTTDPLYQNSQTAPFTWARSTFTTISAGTGNVDAGRWAYHGHYTAETRLSTLASGTLCWDSSVWDFTTDLPTLR